MARRVVRGLSLIGIICCCVSTLAAAHELALPQPPVLVAGHWYVPARPMAAWMEASLQWHAPTRSLTISWRSMTHTWSRNTEQYLLINRHAYLSLRSLARAFQLDVYLRNDIPAVVFGDREMNDSIPVGWRRPVLPRRLSQDQRAVWRLLVQPDTPQVVDGMITQPSEIRVVGRWATAMVRPLNVVTDDAMALLEKRQGEWQIVEMSTTVGIERNYGIPLYIRKRLHMWGTE